MNYEERLTEMVERVASKAAERAEWYRRRNYNTCSYDAYMEMLERLRYGNSRVAKGRLWGGY